MEQQAKTWLWNEISPVLGETDAALYRKLEVAQVKLGATYDGKGTEVTLWDIARLHLAQHLWKLNFESKRAFAIAEILIEVGYKELITGRKAFSADAGQLQDITYLVSVRAQPIPVGVRIITVPPDSPQRGLIELALGACDPQNVILPVHALVLDVWHRLPNLPLEVAEWVFASKTKLHALELRSGNPISTTFKTNDQSRVIGAGRRSNPNATACTRIPGIEWLSYRVNRPALGAKTKRHSFPDTTRGRLDAIPVT